MALISKIRHAWAAKDFYRALFEQTGPQCVIELDGSISYVNQALCSLLKYQQSHIEQLSIEDISEPVEAELNYIKQIISDPTAHDSHLQFEHIMVGHDGTPHECLITASYISEWSCISLSINDITSRKQAEDVVYQLAYYDVMTGLPNRVYFTDYCEQLLNDATTSNDRLALFLIDIDDFKQFNDTHGHNFGDAVLSACAKILAEVVNGACETQGTSRNCFGARLGGDEFAIICQYPNDATSADKFIQYLQQKFEKLLTVEQHYITVTVSAGIALFPYDGTQLPSLLKAADLALYKAKELGKNTYCFHDVSQNTRIERLMEYEQALRYFVDTGDFQLHYQPLYDIEEQTLTGAEALFRGGINKYSDLDIGRLITLAEQTGLIVELGRQILQIACQHCRFIRETYDPTFRIAVNISARQLREDNFVSMVFDTLHQHGLPNTALMLEITETTFMYDFESSIAKLQYLKDNCIGISIDDFGQGYSSMTYIRQIPATCLKIDKEFVDHIADDFKSKEIVKGLGRMANTLGLTSCAEGVETGRQLDVLSDIGIDLAQGFELAKPMPLTQLQKLLEE